MQVHHKSSFLCWALIFSGIFSVLGSCHSMSIDIEEEEESDWDSTTDSGDSTTTDSTDTTTEGTTTVTTESTTADDTDEATTLEPLKPMMTWTETLMVLSNKGSVDEPVPSKEPKGDEISDAVDKAVKALENIKRVWDKKKHESNSKKKKHKVSRPKPSKEDNLNIDVKSDQSFSLKANVEKNGKAKQVHHKSKPKSEESPNEYHRLSFSFSPTSRSDEFSPEKSDFVRKGAEFLRYAWERFKENKQNDQK